MTRVARREHLLAIRDMVFCGTGIVLVDAAGSIRRIDPVAMRAEDAQTR